MTENIKKALMVVPNNYKQVGGMRLPIENYLQALKTCFDVKILEIGYHFSISDLKKLKALISKYGNPDYLIVYGLNQCININRYYPHVFKKNKDIKKNGILMDSEYLYASSIYMRTSWTNVSMKCRSLVRMWIYKAREEKCLNWYDNVLFVSSVDVEFVKRIYRNINAKIYLIENGINIPEQNFLPLKTDSDITLGFLSHMSQAVIEENLMPILDELMPAIHELCPDMKLVVAGKGMEDTLSGIFKDYKYVKYIGYVEDLSEFYSQVDIVLSYTKKENGILNKILEAWAYSKCVIGYDYNFAAFSKAINGTAYIGKDNAAEIAKAVLDVRKGVINSYRIGITAKEFVLKEYSWDEQKRKFLSIFG